MEKFAENFRKFGVSRQIFDKIAGPIMQKFTLSERYFNKLSYIFDFMQKSFLVLKLCHFKVYHV